MFNTYKLYAINTNCFFIHRNNKAKSSQVIICEQHFIAIMRERQTYKNQLKIFPSIVAVFKVGKIKCRFNTTRSYLNYIAQYDVGSQITILVTESSRVHWYWVRLLTSNTVEN